MEGPPTKIIQEGKCIRCLSVPEKPLLCLELLDFFLILGVFNETVDSLQTSLRRDLKTGILLSDSVSTSILGCISILGFAFQSFRQLGVRVARFG